MGCAFAYQFDRSSSTDVASGRTARSIGDDQKDRPLAQRNRCACVLAGESPLHMARADGGQTEMVRTHEPLRNASAEILVFVLAERTAAYIADGVSSKQERAPRHHETNRRQFSIG